MIRLNPVKRPQTRSEIISDLEYPMIQRILYKIDIQRKA